MSIGLLFKYIFFTLFIMLLGIRFYFGWKVRQAGHNSWAMDKKLVEREGTWSVLLRLAAAFLMLALVVLYALGPEGPNWMTLPLPSWLRWLGVGVGITGLLLLAWVHKTLREYWSTGLQLRKNHTLITEGPYRRVRHPMYTTLMLCFAGLAIVSAAWPLLLLAALTVPFFYRVTVKEETMMVEQFGEKYRLYAQQTGGFFPRLFTKPGYCP
jgi:protein-S-isoprenylcysteine O-methyltransferase Ste14